MIFDLRVLMEVLVLLHGHFMGCSFLQVLSTCYAMGSSMGYTVEICSGVILHGLQVHKLFHHGLHSLQRDLYSMLGAPPRPPSFFIHFGVCRAAAFTFFLSSHCCYVAFFFTLL